MISRLLSNASLVHKHLDWKECLEWVDERPFLLQFLGERLTAVFSCAADPPGINWIHCFASLYLNGATDTFSKFLKVIQSDPDLSVGKLYSIGLQDWYCKLLDENGFSLKQNIVVLAFQNKVPEFGFQNSGVLIRPMEPDDLERVQVVDNQAFEPIWSFSESAIQHAFLQSAHASVAEVGNEIIGYELTTENHFSAHLARLAVHPEYQGRGIGASLIKEMIDHFSIVGKRQITVNTQDDNHASISLYKKMKFELTGDSFPVFQRVLG